MLFTGMKNPGCLGCTPETGRSPNCHATCERYLKYREELDELNAAFYADRLRYRIFEESVYDHTIRKGKKWR